MCMYMYMYTGIPMYMYVESTYLSITTDSECVTGCSTGGQLSLDSWRRLQGRHVHDEKAQGYFWRTVKNRQPPGVEPGVSVSALPPKLWPLGDSQPSHSQFSISLCMYCQNPIRDRLVTHLHQGRIHTE